jgi:acyl-CoA reductase-like NAD-dependent aldehyde dehydrogenase
MISTQPRSLPTFFLQFLSTYFKYHYHQLTMAPSANSTNGTANGSKKLDFTTFHNTINGQPQDVDAAVAAAREAFKEWSQTSVEERAEKLTAFGKALEGYQEEFAGLLTKEQGKPVCSPLFSSSHIFFSSPLSPLV